MPRIITLTPNPTYDFAVDADFVEPNRKLRCHHPKIHPGGGGVNVARAAARLGADTLAILTAGGLYGDALKKALAAEQIPARAVKTAGDTRIAFHVHDLGGDHEYRFNLPGANLSTSEVAALVDAVREEARPGDFVTGSGSLPPGAPADFWAKAACAAKEKGALFVLDSIHGLKEALNEGVFLLRQNKHEYQALAGKDLVWPDEIAAFAARIVKDGGAERMVVTHGGDGSVMAAKDGLWRAGALKVKAESAVGAGDSFVAAMLVALGRGDDNETALRYGMAAAAATRMTPGTALFRAEDVDRLFRAPPPE